MPSTKKQMKLAITSSKEIMSLLTYLNELEGLYKYDFKNNHLINCDLSEFEILKKFEKNCPEEFLEDVLKYLSNIHFQRILWNANTLLINCADLSKDTLDFNSDITRGLELLELQKAGKIFLKQ